MDRVQSRKADRAGGPHTEQKTYNPQKKQEASRMHAVHMRRERLRRRKMRRRKIHRGIRRICSLLAVAVLAGIAVECCGLIVTYVSEQYKNTLEAGVFEGAGSAGPGSNRNDSQSGSRDNVSYLSEKEVEGRLAELALEDADIAEIYENRDAYPGELLKALANNPELTEFVRGYLISDGSVTGGFTEEEKEQTFPLFLQWDARWGYAPYGESNIGIAGCGPTCMSMVIFALTGDESATPDKLAAYGMQHGHYVQGTGTAWSFMTDAPVSYGVAAVEIGLDEALMKQYLDRGCPIICAMRQGDFTTGGHFIVIRGYDDEGFAVNDPNSRARSSRRWDFDTLQYQIKNLWAYEKQ